MNVSDGWSTEIDFFILIFRHYYTAPFSPKLRKATTMGTRQALT